MPKAGFRSRPATAGAALVLAAAVLAGCGAAGAKGSAAATGTQAASSTGGSSTTATTVAPTTATTRPAPPSTVPPEPPGWTAVYATTAGIAVDSRTVTLADGSSVTLARFHPALTRFALHVGSQDPPTLGIPVPATNGAAVTAAERAVLLGAFNGGFQMATGSGGFEVAGHVLSPLRTGYASLVMDSAGHAQVGVWGQGLPLPGEQVVSVRQNLGPLISGGVASPLAGNPGDWGATLYGILDTARSAVGEDAAGDIVFAGSMHALPSDLATAMLAAGVTNAMELDINPEWVQLDLASAPGGPLVAAIPGQNRPADQYIYGWTRDFITVLSPRG